ncbi:hypothetical protein B0I35DRAFT_35666 [Stachybotrys elegans]|uniref:Uncharacterized protein n=1 Tax=Stachybotrys elegans TaxID=80388 RepID=A0A8K0WY22_9HYPO|nr:hypothetical protein B0I35DRAFT_35666 [Stachybotrys elegans]
MVGGEGGEGGDIKRFLLPRNEDERNRRNRNHADSGKVGKGRGDATLLTVHTTYFVHILNSGSWLMHYYPHHDPRPCG